MPILSRSNNPWIYLGIAKPSSFQSFLEVNNKSKFKPGVSTTRRIPFKIMVVNIYNILEEHYKITKEDLQSKSQKSHISYVRKVFIYWIKNYYNETVTHRMIAEELHKDVSSIIYSMNQFIEYTMKDVLLPSGLNKPGVRAQGDYTVINNKIYSLCS